MHKQEEVLSYDSYTKRGRVEGRDRQKGKEERREGER